MPEISEIHKELDLVQDVVKRMAANSLQMKTWAIGMLAALVAYKGEELFFKGQNGSNFTFMLNLLLALPVLCFWYLDAYFLRTERMYRNIYKWCVQNRSRTAAYLYDLNTFNRTADNVSVDLMPKEGVLRIMFSTTLWPFYLMPMAFIVGLLIFNLVF